MSRFFCGSLCIVNRQIGVEEFKYGVTGDLLFTGDLLISISRKRLELETSNLACRLTTKGANEKYAKWFGKGLRDLLFKFWDPSISRERWELETSNLACGLSTRVGLLTKEMQN